MRISATKAEGREPSAFRTSIWDLRPCLISGHNVTIDAVFNVWRRRNLPVAHGKQQLARASETSSDQCVTKVPLRGTKKGHLVTKHSTQRLQLACIALRCPCGVTLDILQRLGIDPELLVRGPQAVELGLQVRLERKSCASVGDMRAKEGTIDSITVSFGIGKPFQHEDGASFSGGQSCRLPFKRN